VTSARYDPNRPTVSTCASTRTLSGRVVILSGFDVPVEPRGDMCVNRHVTPCTTRHNRFSLNSQHLPHHTCQHTPWHVTQPFDTTRDSNLHRVRQQAQWHQHSRNENQTSQHTCQRTHWGHQPSVVKPSPSMCVNTCTGHNSNEIERATQHVRQHAHCQPSRTIKGGLLITCDNTHDETPQTRNQTRLS
jgi:hypothetical protein